MKQGKFFHKTRYILMAILALIVIAGIVVAIPWAQQESQYAEAMAADNTVLPDDIQNIFTDYTLTALNENYDTIEELNDFKAELGQRANTYKTYLDRAENIIYGNVRFNGTREFSTKDDAPNKIDQYGNLYYYQTSVLKWGFAGCTAQVIGIYGISGETFSVYVDATDGARIPSLVTAQSKGYWSDSWRIEVTLKKGINTFTFPFANNSRGDHSGVVYILNPYTPEDQNGDVSIYVEGGGFYPVYEKGDDESIFIEQVKEYIAQRQLNYQIPDIAELLPDYALLTIPASTVYDAYVNRDISPAKNLDFWSDYFTKTFEFNGMFSEPDELFHKSVQPYVRINIRRMTAYPAGGAYTYYYHVGIYANEDKWLADYTNTDLNEYNRFACIGHEIGHMLDTNGRTFVETTNNMNAGYAYFRILGKPTSSNWIPFTKSHSRIISDYAVDYKAFDEGRIVYTDNSKYDHNYMIWYQLESVFPGYWGKLNNYYRYDSTASNLSMNEKMVYYSSLVTGVDLSDYFERWGLYMSGSWSASNRFQVKNASQAFNNLMNAAKDAHKIEEGALTRYWYVDAQQFDFSLEHAGVDKAQRVYSGETPTISSLKINGNSRALEISGKADKNLLGYEIYSKDNGGEWKLVGFTYSNKFTDSYASYNGTPTYRVRGVNRYFEPSQFSAEISDPTVETTNNVCKVDGELYSDLKTAFDAAKKSSNHTVYLLADCTANGLQLLSDTVIIEVDPEVHGDVTITNNSNTLLFSAYNDSSQLIIRGNANSKIILDGAYIDHIFPLFYAQRGRIEVENAVISNYYSTANGGVVTSDKATLSFKDCRFDNCRSNTAFSVIYGGSNTNTFQNCQFVNCIGTLPNKYKAAIGLATDGVGSITLEGCTFETNGIADIYVNGDVTFKNGIPKVIVDFADVSNTVKLDECTAASSEIGNVSLSNKAYKARLNGAADQIEFVELTYTLTFQGGGVTHEIKLNGTNEFTFGTERVPLEVNQYISKYIWQGKEYNAGDVITVQDDTTITLVIKEYIYLTLKYQSNGEVADKIVQLKQETGYYLPRFDEKNKEIVKWAYGTETYWAGETYFADEDATLIAIYPATFSYVFVCHDEIVDYGYAKYGETFALDTSNVNGDKPTYWRTASELRQVNEQFVITYDVTFVGVYPQAGEIFYDLSECDVVLEGNGYEYDGSAKTPSVTVKFGDKIVSDTNYKVVYRNNTNAGRATISVTSSGFYAYGSNGAEFEINPVAYSSEKFSVTGLIKSVVYDGTVTKQSPTVTWQGVTLVADKDYEIQYTGNRINAGKVEATIKFKGNFSGQVLCDYEILKANRNLTVSASSFTYGSPVSPSVRFDNLDDATAVYLYKSTSSNWESNALPTNAGDYTLTVTVYATTNYQEASATSEFTIHKANMPAFNGQRTIEVDGEQKTLSEVKLPANWQWEDGEQAVTDGMLATAVYVGADKDNYNVTEIEITLTVKATPIEPSDPDGEKKPDEDKRPDDDKKPSENNKPSNGEKPSGDSNDGATSDGSKRPINVGVAVIAGVGAVSVVIGVAALVILLRRRKD